LLSTVQQTLNHFACIYFKTDSVGPCATANLQPQSNNLDS